MTAATRPQQVRAARARLDQAERDDLEWPEVREAQRIFFALLQKSALAKIERRWRIPASKADDVHAIERAEEAMVAARKRNADLRKIETTLRADLCEAAIAEEIAELMFDLTIAKNREAYGGPERDIAAMQLAADTTLPPLLAEEVP